MQIKIKFFCNIFFITFVVMKIITEKMAKRIARNNEIKAMYNELIKVNGNQKVAIYDYISEKLGISVATVYRVINYDL